LKASSIIIAVASLVAGASAFAQAAPMDIVAALDTNRDGAVSRAEFEAMATANFGRQDANRDGKLTGAERPNHHGQPAPEQNRDQFLIQAMGVFNSEDSNHDGTIAGDEVGRFRNHIVGGSQPRPQQAQH
jgi:hypothetical protein